MQINSSLSQILSFSPNRTMPPPEKLLAWFSVKGTARLFQRVHRAAPQGEKALVTLRQLPGRVAYVFRSPFHKCAHRNLLFVRNSTLTPPNRLTSDFHTSWINTKSSFQPAANSSKALMRPAASRNIKISFNISKYQAWSPKAFYSAVWRFAPHRMSVPGRRLTWQQTGADVNPWTASLNKHSSL